MTKSASEIKGVTTSRKAPVVVPKPTDERRKFMSYDDAVKDNKARKAAQEAADTAYKKTLADHGLSDESPTKQEKTDKSELSMSIETKRKELAEAEKAFKADPSPKLKKKIQKLNTEIDQLEDEEADQ